MYRKLSCALLVSSILTVQSFAQSTAADEKSVQSLLYKNAFQLHLSSDDVKNTRISSFYYDVTSKSTMVYLQQTYKGVDVYGSVASVAFKDDKPVALAINRLAVDEADKKSEKPTVAATAALRTAIAELKLPLLQSLLPVNVSADKHEYEFDNLGISYNPIYVNLLWLPAGEEGHYQLSWQVSIQLAKNNESWIINIDAQKGNLLKKENITVNDWVNLHIDATRRYNTKAVEAGKSVESVEAVSSASYKVIPYPAMDPDHAAPTVVTNPWEAFGSGNLATTLKWNSDGTRDYDSTRGNNVYAQPDLDGKNPTQKNAARSATALPNLTFSATPDFNIDPLKSKANQDFAITNLFYWNNLMHDMSYQYGFTEAAGNFQQNNQGRGGKAADYVIADGLDASGTNNANFSITKDGANGRMQMYLFTPSAFKVKVLKINSPSSYAGFKMSTESAFSTKNKLKAVGPVTANVVLFKDQGNLTSYSACVAAGNAAALKGKIAYIDRGSCNFTDKVLKAQNAGAVGVILGDNVVDVVPPPLGGTNNTITIPTVSITLKDADSLKSFLLAGTIVNATLRADTTAPQLDGDLDNTVVSHEYTHGISSRLTGGPNTICLQDKEQMGEGWSDYMALMMTTNWATATTTDGALAHPIGNYVAGLPTTGGGIRNYPYSTNKSINPWTYDSLSTSAVLATAEVHNVGEVWCEMLWDMTWDLVNRDGINRNFFNASGAGGNSVAVKLVVQGLKLQPCAVGFVSGRDAILKADTLLYGGQYSATIWQAFANRGCGYSAREGKLSSVKDDTAAYDLPPSALIAAATSKMATVTSLADTKVTISPNPARNVVTINIPGNTKLLQIILHSANGQQVAAYSLSGATKSINVSSLATGTYYISITGDGISHKEKIVIQ